jgi:formamidopyrimidine-DNA glycosylase
LNEKVLYERIIDVKILDTDVVPKQSRPHFRKLFKGDRVVETQRYGQYILFRMLGGHWLVFPYDGFASFRFSQGSSADENHDAIRFYLESFDFLAYQSELPREEVQLITATT